MKKKITLVFPGKKEKSTIFGVAMRLPLSILSIAAYMEKKGYEVSVLDARVKEFHTHDFSNDICVGISNSFSGINIAYGLKVAQHIRSKHPEIQLIWGGIHPSFDPKQTVENPLVDFVVKGEGEESFYQLVEALRKKEFNFEQIKGIAYKKDAKIIENPDMPFLNLADLPMAAYHLVNIDYYPHVLSYFDYQSSRGCPSKCGFCYNLKFCNSKWRAKPAEKVIRELAYLFKKYHVKEFLFMDDNFFVDKERVRKICKGMIKNKINATWVACCRLDYFSNYDIDFLNLLKKSGCQQIAFGAESGSQKMLDFIKKGITAEQTIKAVELCKEANIIPNLSFIAGLPKEDLQDVMLTLDIYDKIKKINPYAKINAIGLYSPFPGTMLYDKAITEGFKPPATLEEWSRWQWGVETSMFWISKERRNLLKTISVIARYKYHENDFYLRNKNPIMKPIFAIVSFPLHLSANYRWNNRKFNYPIEWRIWVKLMDIFFEHW